MRQKKNRKKKKNRKIRILTGVVLGVGLAGALFFNVFKIRNIQVAGNTRYTKDDKQNDWSQDPSLSGIDFARLQALQQMASQSRGKSQAEMMPFLLSLMQGNQGGAQFSASEADLIISAIKAGKSKQEAAKIDQMVRLFRSAASGKKR
mgnify:CR=1 FL=1